MEPPQKRQRLHEPAYRPEVNRNEEQFDSIQAHEDYDIEDDYEDYDDDEAEFGYEDSDMTTDGVGKTAQGFDLARRRARNDQKLKSTWEKLFEKYSKDFTGIGDEIDLATGEILQDNGHLKSMQDERDIGLAVGGRGLLRALTVEPEALSTLVPLSGFLDGGNSGSVSQDEEEEAGMVCSSIEQVQEPETEREDPKQANTQDIPESVESSTALAVVQRTLPSREEILERFGDLGPQVIRLLDQQKGNQNQGRIEAPWRVPELPYQVGGRRPVLESVLLRETDNERSPSPERGTSLWADSENQLQSKPRKKHVRFSKLEDEIIFKGITLAEKQGKNLSEVWKDLETRYPHRSAKHWYGRMRYAKKKPNKQTLSQDKALNFDGLDWICSDLPTSSTVEYVKRVAHTGTTAQGEQQSRHTFMGVIISETGQKENTNSERFQELSSHRLGIASFPPLHDNEDSLARSPHPQTALAPELAPRMSLTAKQPLSKIPWNGFRSQIDSEESNGPARASLSDVQRSAQKSAKRKRQTNSGDLLEELRSLYARPACSKKLSLLQSKPGEQHLSVKGGGQEYHVRLIRCSHSSCENSSKLYQCANIEADGGHSDYFMHLKYDHDISMYPCLEARCDRNRGDGFRSQGRLIIHVKAEHDYVEAWDRLRMVVDEKKIAAVRRRCVEKDYDRDALDELQDERFGLGMHLRPVHHETELSLSETCENEPLPIDGQQDKQAEHMAPSSTPKPLTIEGALVTGQETSFAKGSITVNIPAYDHEAVEMGRRQVSSTNDMSFSTTNAESSSPVVSCIKTRTYSSANSTTLVKTLALSSGSSSSPKNLESVASKGTSYPAAVNNSSPKSSYINSSPPQHYRLENIEELGLSIRSNHSGPASQPLSSSPDISKADRSVSRSSPAQLITTAKPSPLPRTKNSTIQASHSSLPFDLTDPDMYEPDELSLPSPSIFPTLTSSNFATHSRNVSQLSSPLRSLTLRTLSTPAKKSSIRRSRHSLPMSAIPPRPVQKSTHGSLSAYKAPRSSLRKMILPETPTKTKPRKRAAGDIGARESGYANEAFKTPGGTERRCGMDGAICGREFCFRCTSARVAG